MILNTGRACAAAIVIVSAPVSGGLDQECESLTVPREEFVNAEGEVRGSWKCLRLTDSALRDHRYANVSLVHCVITTNDLVRGASFHDTTFRRCRVGDLTLLASREDEQLVGEIRLIDCDVDELAIEGGRVGRLVIERGQVRRLELRRCTVQHLEIIGARVGDLEILECASETCIISKLTQVRQLVIAGGSLACLDLAGIDLASEIELGRLRLSSARLNKDQCANIDLSGAIGDGRTFSLVQELDGASGAFGSSMTRALFGDAEQGYHAIATKLMSDGLKDRSLAMRYRAAVCHRKSTDGPSNRAVSIVWGEYLRGRYGTSWTTVLLCAACTWLGFSAAYWVLGWIRYGWALEIAATADGVLWKKERPRIILPYGERLVTDYTLCAMLFSLDNLLLFGSRAFQFGAVADLIKPSPRALVGVGCGRLLGFAEGILGMILIVNFIQAFVAAL